MRAVGRRRQPMLLLVLLFGIGVPGEAVAQSFGCHIGFRQQPRIWVYTDTDGARRHLRHYEISESVGAVLKDLAPAYRRRAYPVEVIRNADTRRLVEGMDLFSCVSGKLLRVQVGVRRLLKNPEDPETITLMTVTFDLSDHSKLDETKKVLLGPFRLLGVDLNDPKEVKAALSPIIANRVADCVFGSDAACAAVRSR